MAENTALTVIETGQLTARVSPMDNLALMSDNEFEERLTKLKLADRRMQRIQRELMAEDVDYGAIPGTGAKPTLLKPGAEKLCRFHHLVPILDQETILGDGITKPHIRIITKCSLHYETHDGPIVGQGVGAANSWEKKYRWREGQRRCPDCGATAIIKAKRFKPDDPEPGYLCWARKGGCGAKFEVDDPAIVGQQLGQVENPDPWDIENTIKKMSAKRAQVDATLRATATSGLFSQDLEDMAEPPEQGKVRTVKTEDVGTISESGPQQEHWCPIHNVAFRQMTSKKDPSQKWYSHKDGDGWCNEDKLPEGLKPKGNGKPVEADDPPADFGHKAAPLAPSQIMWDTWNALVDEAKREDVWEAFVAAMATTTGIDFDAQCRPKVGDKETLMQLGKKLRQAVNEIRAEREANFERDTAGEQEGMGI